MGVIFCGCTVSIRDLLLIDDPQVLVEVILKINYFTEL